MSFKQAKELVERMELSEVTLKKVVKDVEESTKNFQETLRIQEEILQRIPQSDKKVSYMTIAIAANIGLILGLLVGKYLL